MKHHTFVTPGIPITSIISSVDLNLHGATSHVVMSWSMDMEVPLRGVCQWDGDTDQATHQVRSLLTGLQYTDSVLHSGLLNDVKAIFCRC